MDHLPINLHRARTPGVSSDDSSDTRPVVARRRLVASRALESKQIRPPRSPGKSPVGWLRKTNSVVGLRKNLEPRRLPTEIVCSGEKAVAGGALLETAKERRILPLVEVLRSGCFVLSVRNQSVDHSRAHAKRFGGYWIMGS